MGLVTYIFSFPMLKNGICVLIRNSSYMKILVSWLGGERCILENESLRSMLFKMAFLATLISIIKLYDQIWLNYFFVIPNEH